MGEPCVAEDEAQTALAGLGICRNGHVEGGGVLKIGIGFVGLVLADGNYHFVVTAVEVAVAVPVHIAAEGAVLQTVAGSVVVHGEGEFLTLVALHGIVVAGHDVVGLVGLCLALASSDVLHVGSTGNIHIGEVGIGTRNVETVYETLVEGVVDTLGAFVEDAEGICIHRLVLLGEFRSVSTWNFHPNDFAE